MKRIKLVTVAVATPLLMLTACSSSNGETPTASSEANQVNEDPMEWEKDKQVEVLNAAYANLAAATSLVMTAKLPGEQTNNSTILRKDFMKRTCSMAFVVGDSVGEVVYIDDESYSIGNKSYLKEIGAAKRIVDEHANVWVKKEKAHSQGLKNCLTPTEAITYTVKDELQVEAVEEVEGEKLVRFRTPRTGQIWVNYEAKHPHIVKVSNERGEVFYSELNADLAIEAPMHYIDLEKQSTDSAGYEVEVAAVKRALKETQKYLERLKQRSHLHYSHLH